jgi:phage shock protein PspC (stress-responsive transcriptional regulator)
MIGGVAGLGHYFGLDAVWIRIALILLVLLDLELEF